MSAKRYYTFNSTNRERPFIFAVKTVYTGNCISCGPDVRSGRWVNPLANTCGRTCRYIEEYAHWVDDVYYAGLFMYYD